MKEQDPFEGPEGAQEQVSDKKPRILTFFAVGPELRGAPQRAAIRFRDTAIDLCEHVPEGTARSAILERLVETKDSVMRLLKGRP
jgi:hypothetical protein